MTDENIDIRVMLATLATDMKSVKEDVSDIKRAYREDVNEVKTRVDNHDVRLNSHDVSLAKIWGAIGLLAFLLTVGVPAIVVFLH